MAVTNIFDLNMNQQSLSDNYYVYFVNQGDYQSRTIQANLYITYIKGAARSDYNLTDETVVIVYEYTDSNGEIQTTDEFECTKATSIGNNVITFLIPNIVVENSGKVRAQVKVYEDVSTLINSASFLFYVSSSVDVGTYGDSTFPLFLTVLVDSGDPTTSTVGSVSQFYINSDDDSLWYCSDVTAGVYTWNEIVNSGNYVTKTLFDAHTILYATTDNTPVALILGEQTVVGRATGGNIAALAIDSDLSSVSANDDTLPSAKATKSALDGKVDKSTYEAHSILYATTDNTPVALTVTEQTVVGRVTGGNISSISIGIADNNIVQIDDSTVSDNDYAKFTANGLEGRSYSEVLSDIGAATAAQGALADTLSTGWASAPGTWTYASANTITVPSGAGEIYSIGDSIRWKQGGAYKYGVISVVADTLLTIIVNIDYVVASSAITDNYYTHSSTAIGLPAIYTFIPTYTNLTVGAGYNLGTYRTDGRKIEVSLTWVFGSGAAVSTAPKLTLPVTASMDGNVNSGTATYIDSSTSVVHSGSVYRDGRFKRYLISGSDVVSELLSATIPFTWDTDDRIDVTIVYSF